MIMMDDMKMILNRLTNFYIKCRPVKYLTIKTKHVLKCHLGFMYCLSPKIQ